MYQSDSFSEYFDDQHQPFNRRKKSKKKTRKQIPSFAIPTVKPKTKNQHTTFIEYSKDQNLMLHGVAGTGKTFISIYLAMKEILSGSTGVKKLVLVRSVVPTRDMGFLPGNQKEKQKVYEDPYYNIFTELFKRGDSYEYFKNRGTVDFISTSFVRGTTFNDSIIIVDECQNLSGHECDSIITRIGDNSRIIFCGDVRQSDLTKQVEKAGLVKFMKILHDMSQFSSIEFGEDDIVRSELVKGYIIAKLDNGIYDF